ncbi:efflux RND transporter periplasmic adaptor subunit [Bacilli bacterium]|nr:MULTISPECIES: efflux RND transporter periplasmic adaptor subunit [Bacillaceae]PZD87954.1 efflux RND transporter periplasmic adaptor subunit [Bacilli bacterium]PZD90145.1 efflux RND transporter periplasmic adaptor subunit [Bacilli bacterium]PZD92039.1 efflux RND transporter periplasmic adaptor subunit [Bacilli bacterium]RCO06923.1 efflux RND transporter periplasmic adaptor subunit [Bacilli bacterium]RCO08179.1 efflux RND transporter periplasmic adaptor subunit [Bacilli bacterium]
MEMEAKTKKRKIWIAIGIVAIIVGFLGINIWVNADESNLTVEVTTLKEEEITDKVLTQGTLKLAEEQTVYYSPDKGEIAEILVNEGDDIERGKALLTYKNDQLTLEQRQNELEQQSGILQSNSLREQHKEIDKQIEEDKENKMLQEEHDQIKLQQQQANIELEQLKLQKETINQQIADLKVVSDITGKVVEVNEQAAFTSNQMEQQPLIRIGSLDQLIVEGSVSEYDALNIKDGQTVTLTSDAIPDESWTGTVSHISYLPNDTGEMGMDDGTTGVQYPVTVTVDDKDIGLKPGFQMTMEIKTDEHKANTLPITAVQQEEDDNYVYVVVEGKAERREVKVGTASLKTIEISDGITDKDQVIIDPAENIKDGMDVSVQ